MFISHCWDSEGREVGMIFFYLSKHINWFFSQRMMPRKLTRDNFIKCNICWKAVCLKCFKCEFFHMQSLRYRIQRINILIFVISSQQLINQKRINNKCSIFRVFISFLDLFSSFTRAFQLTYLIFIFVD